jgi:hypothetical protein
MSTPEVEEEITGGEGADAKALETHHRQSATSITGSFFIVAVLVG